MVSVNSICKLPSSSNPDPVRMGSEQAKVPAIKIAATQNEPLLFIRANKHLALYGFARNLSTSFFLILLIFITFEIIRPSNSIYLNFSVVGIWFLANIFLLRYLYLYFNYYSKFLFRSFIISNITPRIPPEASLNQLEKIQKMQKDGFLTSEEVEQLKKKIFE